jgi:hypothetical protein
LAWCDEILSSAKVVFVFDFFKITVIVVGGVLWVLVKERLMFVWDLRREGEQGGRPSSIYTRRE